MKTISLYHVSADLTKLEKIFYPRTPQNTINNEDAKIRRICFSDSIQGCINAIGNANRYINERTGTARFVVFNFECNIDDENLIYWDELYKSERVPDAALNHEYWYTREIELRGKIIEISNMQSAYDNRIIQRRVAHKYRKVIDDLLERYGVKREETNAIDTCKLVNEYINDRFGELSEVIIDEIAEKLTIVEREEEDEYYGLVFGKKMKCEQKYVDWTEIAMYHDLEIRYL